MSEKEELPTLAKDEATLCHRHTSSVNHGILKDEIKRDYKAKKPFRVIIVGAEVAGLTAGIGLRRASANVMKKNSFRRWKNNKEIGTAPLMCMIGERCKAPLSVIHRGDLQRILLKGVYVGMVDVRFKHQGIKADPEFKARAQVESSEWIEGDVVIAADGIKSDFGHQMASRHGVKDHSTSTGDAAYGGIISLEKMQGDKWALVLLDGNIGMRWMGPGGDIMAYPVKNNNVYSGMLLHPQQPDAENTESWANKGEQRRTKKGHLLSRV